MYTPCKLIGLFLCVLILLRATVATNSIRPKIYMYKDHELFISQPGVKAEDVKDTFYGLDIVFPELLRESPYLTTNPEEADYFYLNVWLFWSKGHTWDELVGYIRSQGPWWDRKHGRDHLFVSTNDFGRCAFPKPDPMGNATFIVHWGRISGSSYANPCSVTDDVWGAKCDWMLQDVDAGNARPTPCFYPGVDIVVPPTPYEAPNFFSPYIENHELERIHLHYYAGKIDLHLNQSESIGHPESDATYSFGARQLVYRMFKDEPGFVFKPHTNTYWQDLSQSLFAGASAGWGWGGRFKSAATRGAIPVIVQDGILVEWEEQLPLHEYSIRVPMFLAHKMPQILRKFVSTGRVHTMQKALNCTWQVHWWKRPHGRAFEMLMCELKRRVLGAARVELDVNACTLRCGDGEVVQIKAEPLKRDARK